MPVNKKLLLKAIGIGAAISLGVILLLLCAECAVLMMMDSVPTGSLPYLVLIAVAVGTSIGGYIAAAIAGSRGLITGLLSGAAVCVLLFLFSLCSGSAQPGALTAARLGVAALCGAIGGVKGVNRKEKLHIK